MTPDKIDELLRKLDFVAKEVDDQLGLPIADYAAELHAIVAEWAAGQSQSAIYSLRECLALVMIKYSRLDPDVNAIVERAKKALETK